MYEEGEGCDLDFKSAAECYRKAVELQNPHAHFNLGCLLSQGKGVARNQDAAQSHFHKVRGSCCCCCCCLEAQRCCIDLLSSDNCVDD